MDLDALRTKLAATSATTAAGRVLGVTGLALRFVMPGVRVGDVVRVRRRGEPLVCEVVGFDGGEAVAMPLGALTGVGPDDPVEATGTPLSVRAGPALLGRVVDGLGRPLDGGGPISGGEEVPVDRSPPPAMRRRPVDRPIATGVRVLDGLLTIGEGQRVGLFAGSGVGKSTLLGEVARGIRMPHSHRQFGGSPGPSESSRTRRSWSSSDGNFPALATRNASWQVITSALLIHQYAPGTVHSFHDVPSDSRVMRTPFFVAPSVVVCAS